MMVADDAVRFDAVERRPMVIVESGPDRVEVVHCDRVVDSSLRRRQSRAIEPVLEGELRRVDSNDGQPLIAIGPRPDPDVRRRAKPVDARQGADAREDDLPPQLCDVERL